MDRSSLYNIIHLSLSFFLIFLSYNVAQTFQTSSDHAQDGAFAVGIIYLVFCLANLALSAYLVRILSVRLTLILSSLTYVLFIAANIKYYRLLLFVSAFLLGLGAALLWTAHGAYVAISITKYERSNNLYASSSQGLLNGIFFGIYQFQSTVGNLLASYLFHLNYPQLTIFTILTVIAAIGSIGLIFIRPVKLPENTSTYEIFNYSMFFRIELDYFLERNSILGSLAMILDIPFLVLIPSLCYLGLVQGLIYGVIPQLIKNKSRKFLLFAFYGLINSSSSMIFGKLSDYLKQRLFIFILGILSHMIIFVLLLTIWQLPLNEDRIVIFLVMIVCLSIGEAAFTTQLYAVLTLFYGETRPTEAFSCMKIFQSGCTALGFVAQVYCSVRFQLIFLIVALLITLLTLIYEHYRIKSLDTGKDIKSKRNEKTDQIEQKVPLNTLANSV